MKPAVEKNSSGLIEKITTQKHTYIFKRPGEPIGLARWSEYERQTIACGFGQTFNELLLQLQAIQEAVAEDVSFSKARITVICLIDTIKNKIIEQSKTRWSKAFYICTLLAERDGVPETWSPSLAEDYIQDWESSGLVDEFDLFFFASNTITNFAKIYVELRKEQTEKEARISKLATM